MQTWRLSGFGGNIVPGSTPHPASGHLLPKGEGDSTSLLPWGEGGAKHRMSICVLGQVVFGASGSQQRFSVSKVLASPTSLRMTAVMATL